jgi:hypothetical protein
MLKMFHSRIEFPVILWWIEISSGLKFPVAVKQTNCMCDCAIMQYLNEDASSIVLIEDKRASGALVTIKVLKVFSWISYVQCLLS